MKIVKPYEKTDFKGEINNGEVLVETAGYLSVEQQIENLILAGRRLEDWRADHFDYYDSLPKGFDDTAIRDPTREPNFDMADAHQMACKSMAKVAEYNARREAKLAAREAEKAAKENADKVELEVLRSEKKASKDAQLPDGGAGSQK
jgi:hypothetical protein